jgi:deoxyhypusine synthase
MPKNTFKPIDLSKVKTYPAKKRFSKVKQNLLGKRLRKGMRLATFLDSLPHILASKSLKEISRSIAHAHSRHKTVLLGMGAHSIKVGLSPLIIDLMGRGILSAVAMNGAGIIHDFELAFMGQTSEEVGSSLKNGSFGMARETGTFLNDAITEGYEHGVGIGQAVGRAMLKKRLPHRHLSILAAAARLGIPVTVHVAMGTDIIHMHPKANGEALGAGSLADFHTLTSVVTTLKDGVFLNFGSAVILPEVFLKALNLARNLGHPVTNLTTVNLDFLSHYRPLTNVVHRPTLGSGKGYNLIGHLEIMAPLLFASVLEEL